MNTERTEILSIAVVGHPNEGKSSVVSTLTERDDIRVSATPGETEYSVEYTVELDGSALISFLDTPGFQVPKKTLKWLSRRPSDDDAQTLAVAFSRDFSGRPAFVHDCRILDAVAAAHGVLYIIDAGKPMGPDDFAEMEILRRLGKTRMAILNSKSDDSEYLEQWKAALNRHFNAVRRFNALEAAFDERIRLLSALRLTGQDWESALERVIEALYADREGRFTRAADIICSLITDCMTKTIKAPLNDKDKSEDVQSSMMPSYTDWLRRREDKALKALRKLFRHRHFEMDLNKDDLMDQDLFARETWRVLGLSRRQLSTVSALAGAAAGTAVDLALGEITFGVFMAGGAVIGGLSGLAGSRPLSRVRVKVAGTSQRLGRRYLELGPPKDVQMAFILIDRALLYLDTVSRWAHARRERAEAGAVSRSFPMTQQWPRRDLSAVTRFVMKIIKGRTAEQELENFRRVLIKVIRPSVEDQNI